MISRFFTADPAPLDVRVARVVVPPWPLAAYFLIRMPQVADGVMVPWPEAVTVTLLVVVLVPLWLYWVADLVGWRRERRTATPSQLELTADLSAHGVFAGDLAALVDAEAHGRMVPVRFRDAVLHGVRALDPPTDDRPTEPLLLTHEFTPASGIAMDAAFADADAGTFDWDPIMHGPMRGSTGEGVIMSWDPAVDGQQVIARTPDGRIYPVDRVDVVKPSPTGRHRKREQAHPIPPIADVPNAEAYAFLNRSRELGY